jgi:hypothetical protein
MMILYNVDGLYLTIYACYSWEMALNIIFNVAFINMQGWKEAWEEVQEVNNMKPWLLFSDCIPM